MPMNLWTLDGSRHSMVEHVIPFYTSKIKPYLLLKLLYAYNLVTIIYGSITAVMGPNGNVCMVCACVVVRYSYQAIIHGMGPCTIRSFQGGHPALGVPPPSPVGE